MMKKLALAILAFGLVGVAVAALTSDADRSNPIPKRFGEHVRLVNGAPANLAWMATDLVSETLVRSISKAVDERFGIDHDATPFKDGDAIATFQSRKYHASGDTYSVLRIDAYDADAKHNARLIRVMRTDRWYTWAKEFHSGLPMPFKVWYAGPAIVDEELAWLGSVLAAVGGKSESVVSATFTSGSPEADVFDRLIAALKEK